MPNKIVDEFDIKEYDCLILPGCSNLRLPLRDDGIIDFLKTFEKTMILWLALFVQVHYFCQRLDF